VEGTLIELVGAPNPTMRDVGRVSDELKRIAPDRVIAVGGGGIIDLAKAGHHVAQLDAPLVAIPTTAGSGSEATPYASITVEDDDTGASKRKVSLCDASLVPKIVCLEPELLKSVPKEQRAFSGMDVVVQSVESYWSRFQTDASSAYSLESIRLWTRSFAHYLEGDFSSSRSMQMAAFLAGQAIAITPTTACHAVSYPLTTDFGIPHGWAVALLFARMIRWNSDALGERSPALCSAFGVSDLDGVAELVENLMRAAAIPTRLSSWGISGSEIPYIVARSYRPDRMNGAPRSILPVELEAMLEAIL
jgi:alcohol dehydrogenase class IV